MKIRINSLPYSTDECDYKMSDNLLSKQLHTFDLQISYYLDENMYNYLELLILQFFTSLKNLTMDILLKNLLNGKRLEKFFRLKQFHFRIQMILPSDNLFDMSTFPTDLQIISYTNHQENTQTLLTLPNTFETFDQISSDIVNYHSNINNPIKLIKVKQIKLYDTRSYTLKFFNFIKQTFPCINTLEFFHYCYLTDDMINDDKITLDSIHSLFIHASLDYSRIKRLLLLTPNIKHLSTSYQTLLILKQDLENDINHYERLHRICQQIITLNIRSMNKGEMQSIFLNATII
ncbi:unnamed protein product [Didymodactylos carnosus]|nr:unnamed protein product [Didymodactylos carnosus]CAF4277652.1 unnamed protein product [Didymodactylos carnosus]